MISLNRLSAKRGAFQLDIDTIRLNPGELVAVLGNNGSGKSTFLAVLAGLLPYRGCYQLDGVEYSAYPQHQKYRQTSLLPQKTELNMPFDVAYVILTGRFPHTDGFRYSSEDYRLTDVVLKQFDIEHLRQRPFNELSGGEKQRVLLARAINHDAPILLLDEPMNGIDLKHQHETVAYLHQMKKEKTILAVMHDLSTAIREFDRFLVFSQGRLALDVNRETIDTELMSSIFEVSIEIQQWDAKTYVHTGERTHV